MFNKKKYQRAMATLMATGLFLSQAVTAFGVGNELTHSSDTVSNNAQAANIEKSVTGVAPLAEDLAFQIFEAGSEGAPQLPATIELTWEQQASSSVAPSPVIPPTSQNPPTQEVTLPVSVEWELQRIELYPVVDEEAASDAVPENEIFTAKEDGALEFSTDRAGIFTYKATLASSEYTLATGVELPTITANVMQDMPAMAMMSMQRSSLVPEVDTATNRIFGNGYSLNIAAGDTSPLSQISFIDNDATTQYLTLDDRNPFSTTATNIDVSGYTIFGGSNGTDVTTSQVTMIGGSVLAIYGGGYNANVTVRTNLYLYGGSIGTAQVEQTNAFVFGGGLADGGSAVSNNINILLQGTTIGHNIKPSESVVGRLFGGGHSASAGSVANVGNTTLTINSGSIIDNFSNPNLAGSIFGGGYAQAGSVNSGNIQMNVSATQSLTTGDIYGGGYVGANAIGKAAAITLNVTASSYDNDNVNILGGMESNSTNAYSSAVVQSTDVTVSGAGTFGGINGGGNRSTVSENAKTTVTGAINASSVNGTGAYGYNGGSVSVTVQASDSNRPQIEESVSALSRDAIVSGNTVVNVIGATIGGSVNGGGWFNDYVGYNSSKVKNATLSSLTTNVTDSQIGGNIYGGGLGSSYINGNTFVNVTGTDMDGVGSSIYGGIGAPPPMRSGNDFINFEAFGIVHGNTNVVVKNTKNIDTVYGGGRKDVIYGGTNVDVQGSTAQFVFGGGYSNAIYKSTNVKLSANNTISNSVFGGCRNGESSEPESALLSASPSEGSVFIAPATILENTYVSVAQSDISNNIYGGGLADTIKGSTYVEFLSGSVKNVFGSGTFFLDGKVDTGNSAYLLGVSLVTGSDSATLIPTPNGGNATVKIAGGTVAQNVYGSGDGFNMQSGNTDVSITGGNVGGTVYGGGNGLSFVGYTYLAETFFSPLEGRGNTFVKVFGGTVNSVIGGGNSATDPGGYNSSVNGNVFVFIDANAEVKSNMVYTQQKVDLFSDVISIISVKGKSTFVVENKDILIKETQTDTASTDKNIENILRWVRSPSYTMPHWAIKGEVVLPVDVTGAIAITKNQELYMPDDTNLIAGESDTIKFVNEGYIITHKPTLDSSIESNNVPGNTNIGSRIFRGGAGADIALIDANYTLNQTATPLDANPALTGFWQFLGTKIGAVSGYDWYEGSNVLSGENSSTYTPLTTELGTKTYRAIITAPYRFETVPSGVLSDVFATGGADIIVTDVKPQPPSSSSSSSSSGGTSGTGSSSSSSSGGTSGTGSSSTGGGTSSSGTGTVTPVISVGGSSTTSSSGTGTSTSVVTSSSGGQTETASSSTSSTSATSQTSQTSSSSDATGQETGGDVPPPPQITPKGDLILSPKDPNEPIKNVYVNGQEISPVDYIIDESGNITLGSEFLSTLGDGEHTIGIRVNGQLYEATVIMDNGVPLGAGPFSPVSDAAWSLFDLLMTILALLSPLVYVILVRKRKAEQDEELQKNTEEQQAASKRRTLTVVIGILFGFINLVLFLLTQDLTQPMIFFDRYSIWFALIFIVQTIVEIVFRRKKSNDENQALNMQHTR